MAGLVARAVARDPSRPFVTYYDRASGERTELSGTTLLNWVSKTVNLLRDDLDVGPGQTVVVALPPHWQSAAILLASWWTGAAVRTDAVGDGTDGVTRGDVVFCAEDRLMELADADARDILVTSLHALGLPVAAKPTHVLDYAVEVRGHGDQTGPPSVDDDSPALYAGSYTLTHGSLAEVTLETADRLGLREGDRVMAPATTIAAAGPVVWLLASICTGSSLVLVRVDDEPDTLSWLRHIAEQERVTATIGVDLDSAGGTPAGPRLLG